MGRSRDRARIMPIVRGLHRFCQKLAPELLPKELRETHQRLDEPVTDKSGSLFRMWEGSEVRFTEKNQWTKD